MKFMININAQTLGILPTIFIMLLGLESSAKVEKRIVEARTLCLRIANEKPDIFIGGVEKPHQILLPVQTFSGKFECVLEDGVAIFYKEDGILPNGEPKKTVVAKTKVKASMKEILFFFDVAKKSDEVMYKVIALDDSLQKFPLGQMRVLNLLTSNLDIAIGEHRKILKPGNIAVLPAPKRKNSSNMTNVLGRIQLKDNRWAAFSEFRSKLTESIRVFVISHYDKSSDQPKIKMYRDIPRTLDLAEPNIGSK